MDRSISVILPNYNGENLLRENLPYLIESLCDIEHEIIVIDDHSTDNSVALLTTEFPDINIIESRVNEGFSATCNKGIHAATKPVLCIVNTDVRFTPSYFREALPYFDDKNLFAIKGDIINYRSDINDVINIEKAPILYYKKGFLRFDHSKDPSGKEMSGRLNEHFVLLGCCFICNSSFCSLSR